MDKLNENFEELLEAADIFVYNYDGVFEDVYVKAHPEKYKRYHSFSDLVKDVGNEAGYHRIQQI